MGSVVTFSAEQFESVAVVVPSKWGPLRVAWSERGGGIAVDKVQLVKGSPGFTLDDLRAFVTALKGGAALGQGLQESKAALVEAEKVQVEAFKEAIQTQPKVADMGAIIKVPLGKVLADIAKAAPVPSAIVEDMSVFMRLTKLADIVTEIQKRGAATFEDIWAYITQLDDQAVCPTLDRIKAQGPLQERLRTHCASRNIPGSLKEE